MKILDDCKTCKEYIALHRELFPEAESITIPRRFIKISNTPIEIPEIDENFLRYLVENGGYEGTR